MRRRNPRSRTCWDGEKAQSFDQLVCLEEAVQPDRDVLQQIRCLVCGIANTGILKVDDMAAGPVPQEVRQVAVPVAEHAVSERTAEVAKVCVVKPGRGGT
jgi:hypothetical protein